MATSWSLPSRGAWIEMLLWVLVAMAAASLPSRGAWIEIGVCLRPGGQYLVAPLAGSVDRNRSASRRCRIWQGVAPLAGSVDRNQNYKGEAAVPFGSLPSRGAWIEILQLWADTLADVSLPSRGAWIEIGGGLLLHLRPDRRSPRGERG